MERIVPFTASPKSRSTLSAPAIAAATAFLAAMASAAADAAVPQGVGDTCFRARCGTEVVSRDGGPVFVRNLGTYGWPGVEIRPAGNGGAWDWSNVGEVRVAVSNGSDRAEQIYAAVVPEGTFVGNAPTRSSRVPAHAVRTIVIPIADDLYETDEPVVLETMRGKIPAAKDRRNFGRTERVDVFWSQRTNPHMAELTVLGVETGQVARVPQTIPAASFFPFVDKYGQFKHADWPGKIHSDEDFAAQRAAEEAWLAAHPGSPTPDVNEFGGWEGGPQLKATGFFRTEKVGDKWWFVDPKGRLFFSLGIDCLYAGTETRVSGREHYFEELPGYGHGIYTFPPGSNIRSMSFIFANLERKYGEEFKPAFAENIHARFKAWGINTLGNWAHDYVWTLRRTPYVATIDFSSKTKSPAWTNGHGRNVPDVDSPQFEADIRERAEKLAEKMKDDPWCVGIFVDNELGWLGCDGEKVADIAEKYYSTVRAVLKEVLPNHLYLGSRIHFAPESVWLAAARHCDVVSNNFYEYEPSYDLPASAPDKPIIIGEFHFGAKDRGHLVGGCVTVFDQKERAACFKHYVRACLDNPRYIGCHWFQYQDQPVSGRGGDGENYNDGFVSMCDVPYPEMVEASREVAAELYTRRFTHH